MNQSIVKSADISKLKNILKKSKDVMNQVEGENSTVNNSNIDNRIDNYQETNNFNYNKPVITKESYEKSNMPQHIKDMMMNSQVGNNLPPSTTTQINENIHIPKTPQVNEGLGKDEIKALIKETMLEFLLEDYSKKITENTIKKTINTLIKEGKIKSKK